MPGSEISKFYYTYVLYSPQHGELYYGRTQDLQTRIKQHNHSQIDSTKQYRPWQLIYYEACLHKNDAKRRENYLKTTQGSRMLKRRLKDYFYAI